MPPDWDALEQRFDEAFRSSHLCQPIRYRRRGTTVEITETASGGELRGYFSRAQIEPDVDLEVTVTGSEMVCQVLQTDLGFEPEQFDEVFAIGKWWQVQQHNPSGNRWRDLLLHLSRNENP